MSNRFAFGSDRQVMARLDAQEQRESQGFATRVRIKPCFDTSKGVERHSEQIKTEEAAAVVVVESGPFRPPCHDHQPAAGYCLVCSAVCYPRHIRSEIERWSRVVPEEIEVGSLAITLPARILVPIFRPLVGTSGLPGYGTFEATRIIDCRG